MTHDHEEPRLREYLERFGTIRDVAGAEGLTQEGTFGTVVPIIDALLSERADAARVAAQEKARKERAFAENVAALEERLPDVEAQAAAARANADTYENEDKKKVEDGQAAADAAAWPSSTFFLSSFS